MEHVGYREGGVTHIWHSVRIAFLAVAAALVALQATTAHAVDGTVAPEPAAIIDGRAVAVLDGDSLLVDGAEWRLIGYDAPEVERATCEGERRTGIHARDKEQRMVPLVPGPPS